MKLLTLLIMIAATATSCTDGRMKKLLSCGDSRSIECWSGGTKIYSGTSTGKISSKTNSDGYFFEEKNTGKLMEVSGNCILGK